MSRVGRNPIQIPPQVKVEIQGEAVSVEGPKGKLAHRLPDVLRAERVDSQVRVHRQGENKRARSLHGLHRSILQNMVTGVLEGFVKELELHGVGYRAQVSGGKLEMFVGLTHPVVYAIPSGITIEAPKPTQLIVRGVDKHRVGQVAARIRAFARPEPYKGKGIRYVGEVIRRKAGKAVA